MRKYSVAVIGATGSVGGRLISLLEERNFPISELKGVASEKSVGKKIPFKKEEIIISSLENFDFRNIDIAFFCAGSEISSSYAPKAASGGAVVIDKSSFFRMDPEVPLVVPEVNPEEIIKYKNKNIISAPNCCVTPLAVALKPLDNSLGLSRIVVSTYQSCSGAGKAGAEELRGRTFSKETETQIFPKEIAFNSIPQIGVFGEGLYTGEEKKAKEELSKIMGKEIKSSFTCVRVPVFRGHCLSVNIELKSPAPVCSLEKVLRDSGGISLLSGESYHTPIESEFADEVLISRLRADDSRENCFNLWIVSDNLRKGSGLNSIHIAERLIELL